MAAEEVDVALVGTDRVVAREAPGGRLGNLLEGATFVISGTIGGFSREEAQAAIEARGGKSTSSVSGKTTALVVGESPGASKVSKAEELGTPIIDGEMFKALLDRGLDVLN